MGKKAVVTRTETVTDDDDEDGSLSEKEKDLDVALFDDLGSTDDTRIEKVHVSREDPDEGYLGVLEPTATNLEVYNRWGGSKYHFTAKNARGRIVTKRTVKIGGEPIFLSEVAEMRYRRANGLPPKKKEVTRDEGEFSAKELIAMSEARIAAERVDAETREERRRREDTEREEKARKEEREWRASMERERADRDARARADERDHQAKLEQQRRDDEKRREDRIREDETRREKEHERQLAATMLAAKESQEKNQQFFTNMLAMTKAGDKAASDPMAQVTQILTIVEALKGAGGGGEQDAVSTLLSRLPETLQAAGNMVGGAIREAKGLPAQSQAGSSDEGEEEPGAIKLTGEAAAKVRELVMHLVSKGQDPEKTLIAVADHLMGKNRGTAVLAAKAVEKKRRALAASSRRRVKPKAAAPSATKVAPKTAPVAPTSVRQATVPVAKPPGAP
jgi:hypothetical protein